MLRQIGTLPPEAQGCFYDYLTGTTYTAVQGKLYKVDPKQGQDHILVPFSNPNSYATPENYLHRLVGVSGEVALNTQGTIATNKSNGVCVVRSSRSLSDRSCWQFHVPGSLHGVELGVMQVGSNGSFKQLNFTFNSSTSRTITFLVDESHIKAWVNDSALSKKNCKALEWDLSECYPYAKLTTQGSTVVFNPFATEPNTKISRNNPFNVLPSENKELSKALQVKQYKNPEQAKVLEVKQLDKDRMLLIGQGNHIKIVTRNPENNQVQFSNFAIHDNVLWNLFTNYQWAKVTHEKHFSSLKDINWENKGYALDDVLTLLRELIIRCDHQVNVQISHILLSKLAIIRPYVYKKIPNLIHSCELDHQPHHYSEQYFKFQNSEPLRIIPASTVTNTAGWFKLQGTFASASEHYVCSVKRVESNSKEVEVFLYYCNEFEIKKVFNKVCGDLVQFSKAQGLEGFSDVETSLWKQNSQTTQIYKILSNCFTTPANNDNSVFEPKQKDIIELTDIFKTPKEEAITALEQTGNIEDALAWLADPNHRATRKKKVENQKNNSQESQSKINCSIIELSSKSLIAKLLLQLDNSIYLIGFDPKTFAQKYVQKTQKGFMNLSTFQYGVVLNEISNNFINEGFNHNSLVLLDKFSLKTNQESQKSSIVSLYRSPKGAYITYRNQNQSITKVELELNDENCYREPTCFKLSTEKIELFSGQEAGKRRINRSIQGELISDSQIEATQCQPFTVTVFGSDIFANYKHLDSDQLVKTVDVWVKFSKSPQLHFNESEETSSGKYIPLLVEHGPPGCNLNYPICSILYPKAPLPFLANYPYSLTFRHLHSKCMNVSEVVIQRIGQKHNVNEIKQGYIYFADDSNVQSERYHFRFDHKNELAVEIKQNCYWKYMIIEPTYHNGSRMPYEIGFLGAKGVSIESEEYVRLLRNKIEQSLEIDDQGGKCRFELVQIEPLSHSTYKATLQFSSHSPSKHLTITSKDASITTPMHNVKIVIKCSVGKDDRQEFKTAKIITMKPEEVIAGLTKAVAKSKDGQTTVNALILKEIANNDAISLEKYDQNQIKILVDLFFAFDELSVKDFQKLLEKTKNQSKAGAQYIDKVIHDIGKSYVHIAPHYMQVLLNKIVTKENQKLSEHILHNILEQVPILRNPHYKILQKEHSSPYLMLETDYYSKYYYNQIQEIVQVNTESQCEPIYNEELIQGYKFVTIKQNKYRKYIIKLDQKSSIKYLLLRFDKSQAYNKAVISVYAHLPPGRSQTGRVLMHEHQWIQVTKNPYRQEMMAMFGSNHSWLNAFGVELRDRVEVSYLEVEVMFNTSGICGKESQNNMIEVMPEIYGFSVGSAEPVAYLDDNYFKVSEDEKVLLSKIPLRLQIQSSEQKNSLIFNKYLINKQNIEYQLYENSSQSQSESKLEKDDLAVEYINDIRYFTRLDQEAGQSAKKADKMVGLAERYHRIMRGLSASNSHVRISRKVSLDYCYTIIMWILEIYAKKGIAVSEKMGQQLLDNIIKSEIGPVALACFRAISRYPSQLLESLNYIKINSEDEKSSLNSISSSFIKTNNEIHITQATMKKIVQSNDTAMAESLLNIIIDTKAPNEENIRQCIDLGRFTNKHEKVLKYILRKQERKHDKMEQKEKHQHHRYIFNEPTQKHLYRRVIHYIYTIPEPIRDSQFLSHLNPKEIQLLVLEIRSLNHNKTLPQIVADSNQLLNMLFNHKDTHDISLDVVSLIFELDLGTDEKWDYLAKCIRFCPAAEDMIHCQYLSSSREQREELLQLVVFHRDILLSSAKSEKNSQLLANFLGEIYYCNKKLFIEVVASLPEGQAEIFPIHSDIYSLIIRILEEYCSLGGVQGAKLCTLQQSFWLSSAVKLFKISSTKLQPETLVMTEIDNLLKWYLLNNEYEATLSNPINRSQSITYIKQLSEYVSDAIRMVGGAKNINKIFKIYTNIKEEIKKDHKRLAHAKALVLERLQYGVFKLIQGSMEVANLTNVLIGDGETKGLAEQIIAQLQAEQRDSAKQVKKPLKQIELTEQVQAYAVQGSNLTNLQCKDLQSYKTGSKSFLTKVSVSSKKLYLKSPHFLYMNKFVIGFNVQDTTDKNNILPDSVELYGGRAEEGELTVAPVGMKKIAEMEVVEDQSYTQFGVRLFAVNFDCLRRQYRNSGFNLLELRMKTISQPSASDALQGTQKTLKNAVYHVSFVSISGHKQEPEVGLSYSNIYMKILTFLSKSEYEEALKAFIKHVDKNKGNMSKLIELLSTKAQKADSQVHLQKLLIAFGRQGVPVLSFLLQETEVNQTLVNKILKSNLSSPNIDLVLDNILAHPLKQQNLENIIQNIKLASLQPSPKQSKIKDQQIYQICKNYQKEITKSNESQKAKEQAHLSRKILACLTTTPQIFHFNQVQLIEKLSLTENGTVFYPIIAAFVSNGNQLFELFLASGKLDRISQQLLKFMEAYKTDKSKQIEHDISNSICLLSALSIYPPIRQRLINNPDNTEISRLPLKIFKLLSNDESLIEQYPVPILKKFINFFQSTCTSFSADQSACSQEFAAKLIEVMVKLPEVSSVYHNYFIHQFFFHIINAHNGVLVNFVWKGHKEEYYGRPTEILRKLPIRKNDSIREYKGHFYRLASSPEDLTSKGFKLLTFKDKIVATKDDKWSILEPEQIDHQIKQIRSQKTLTIIDKSGTQKPLSHISTDPYKCFIHDHFQIRHQLLKLLTNQTLLRITRPTIFPTKYNSTLPITLGMLPYIYLIPAEITVGEMLKEMNICGYLLQEETRNSLEITLYGHGKEKVGLEEKLADVFNKVSSVKPLIQFQIKTHDLFKQTTIQKIASQNPQISTAAKFIPQETIFKSFQKQKGLQKMIKVIMACVKNWGNQEQSKIWSQYLSQLSSFSCFPIFSSIYMNKQENVELLFGLLSGLPDKEDNKKWLDQEKKSVRFLYDIIKNVFEVEGEQAIVVRNYAVESGFYETMLERLHLITKENKRVKNTEADQEQQEVTAPQELTKKTSEQEYKKEIKKKKGIGYGNDSSSNQKWDIAGHEASKKELSDQVIGLIKILEKFLSYPKFKFPSSFLESTYTSAILPILESSLRGGSLLQISKNAQLFKQQLRFIRTLAKNEVLVPTLMEIPKCYEPKQLESIFSLLTTLEGISKIFINCLTGSVSEKTSEEIAKDIVETYNQVQESIEHYKSDHVDEEADKKILELPLAKKYPILMKDLRFDYIDMKDKNGKMKHHYSSSYQAKHTAPATKTIRLAQQLADISQALPIEHTNAIFVRCDKDRVDFMQALIMGSNGTPYGHGAYLFDIHFDDSYPNNPPKVNLTTTGSGAIRFNPNLYACGKVCLSLLGTWRGSAMENWDSKVSTLLQVLVSIQSIIMAEEIYFNEPGFEHEQGTVEGQKKNQAYSNIVRYGNIKFAMIENMKNPPKGFETVIRRHFYLKKEEIMTECKKWLKFAEKREASYTGLVNDHNNNWSKTFNKSKTEYKTMLEKAINELEVELNKLPEPSAKDLVKQTKVKKEKKQKKETKIQKDENLQDIDVTYDNKNADDNKKLKEMDINDEKVKDRWSRYIGAMGLDAVNKQSKASILMFGISALGMQIAKNIVMSGCKRFTVCDDEVTEWKDLSGQFYLTEEEIGKSRVDSCLYKLQDLNNYVRVDSIKVDLTKLQEQNTLKDYQVVITTVHNDQELILLDNYCRKNNIKFIAVKSEGPYGYIFNDFGQKFEVLDKNGEQAVQCFVQNITNEQKGVVTLMKGQKHPYEDGDEVKITKVKGMDSKTQEGKTINDTIHKITVINQSSFKIGDTTGYSEYAGNGLVKNMKIASRMDFKPLQQCLPLINIDQNLEYYDFAKSTNNKTLHKCFRALSQFKTQHKGTSPRPWNWQDAEEFYQLYEKIAKAGNADQAAEIADAEKGYVYKFSFTCSGSFAPLAAFYGGLIAQEAFKAITSKYMPINQFFLTDFTEIIEELPKEFSEWKDYVSKKNYKPQDDRFEGLRSIVGDEVLGKVRECKVFVIGSGAIGCELLKNYAMVNLATSDKPGQGTIVVTDPDHIEVSNLNRQFLFREKHLQKPKSATAAAVVKQMNKHLKGQNKIRAKLLKVCEATKDTFSNQFFESMDIVTNALDNVQARQYVDLRCVENKVALLESGTLSTKGHVQVIIPYKTETYGSKADPAEEGDIPHCTLKMFPEETLHCVEWARDIFGKTFTMKPKSLMKILETLDSYTPTESDSSVLKESLEMLQQRPATFDDAVYQATKEFYKFYRNDIKQLLYTYPLDAKTKDGKDFWKLPKRPPTPIEEINVEAKLHGEFITSYAVLLCKIFNVPYPKDFRTEERRAQILKQSVNIKVDPFVPSDKLAKEMATEVEQNKEKKKEEMEEQIKEKEEAESSQDYIELFKEIKQIIREQKKQGNAVKITAEEFEKDDDANGHIDLIYSMANLRASNYKLDAMDWITTKLKAGRITPALSTTTSCIAALQTIELIKYLKKLPVDQMKNTFINLAVPIIQAGEPGEIQKIKIHGELTTNLWERWTIDQLNLGEATMADLFKQIEQKYKIKIKTLNIAGAGPIYSDLVLGLQSKKEEREQFMKKKFKDVIAEQIAAEDLKNYIDLTLVMAVGEEFIKHVPTVRINFKK